MCYAPRMPHEFRDHRRPDTWRDPVVEADKEGVDRGSIRKNRALTPEQRIEQLMELQRFAAELRRAGAAARKHR